MRYVPPRLLDRDTVRAVATALDALDVEVLRTRFDPDAMTASCRTASPSTPPVA
ncbi:DUF1877 family protein [Micromonospora sp. NPDC047620]|uniref:DUF1877 family protein n=1 Tax=Micromonospora sp. NPDC047620 TaxID=3364251 RepID=UPI003710149D